MGQYSKKLINRIIYLIIGFTAIVLILSGFDHSVPDSLIVGFYGLVGTELVNLARIKINKVKKGEKDDIQSDL